MSSKPDRVRELFAECWNQILDSDDLITHLSNLREQVLAIVEELEREANANLPTKHYTDEIVALKQAESAMDNLARKLSTAGKAGELMEQQLVDCVARLEQAERERDEATNAVKMLTAPVEVGGGRESYFRQQNKELRAEVERLRAELDKEVRDEL